MGLTLDFLLTLLIELPIIAIFFKRKKRQSALMQALMINLITWPIAHILRLTTDININYIEIGVVIIEGFGYWMLTQCGWKKGFLMSIIANLASFALTQLIKIDADVFQNKQNIIIH